MTTLKDMEKIYIHEAKHEYWAEHRFDRIKADTLERIIQQEIDSIMGIKIEKENK